MIRVPQLEWMDEPTLAEEKHAAALAGLARINRISRSVQMLMPGIRQIARSTATRGRPLRLLDLASGAGDIPVGIAQQARREGLDLAVQGCDFSAVAVRYATERAARCQTNNVHFIQRDLLKDHLPDGFDVVMASLFIHHLSPADAVTVMHKMADAASQLVLINDLRRSRGGLLLAYVATRALSRSDVVHTDGPRSVRQAYTIEEARQMGEQAGMAGCKVHARFPCRWLLSWRRT